MINFVKQNLLTKISREIYLNRLYLEQSNFANAVEFDLNGIFPNVFEKNKKFDILLADLGYSSFINKNE